jgi:hypothetical protein
MPLTFVTSTYECNKRVGRALKQIADSNCEPEQYLKQNYDNHNKINFEEIDDSNYLTQNNGNDKKINIAEKEENESLIYVLFSK